MNFRTPCIYGPIWEAGKWRIRSNYEINQILDGEDLVKHIKSLRIGWLSHVERQSLILQPLHRSTYVTAHFQPFRRFTYVTAHSTTFPLLHLRHMHFTYVI